MQCTEKLPYQDNCVPVGLNNMLLEKRKLTHANGILLKSLDSFIYIPSKGKSK